MGRQLRQQWQWQVVVGCEPLATWQGVLGAMVGPLGHAWPLNYLAWQAVVPGPTWGRQWWGEQCEPAVYWQAVAWQWVA